MHKNITKFFLILIAISGLTRAFATEVYPFFLHRQDGTILEGYFSPPTVPDYPIIFAIQGSSCESAMQWHQKLSDRANQLGFGVIVLEKQGISKDSIDLWAYNQNNCLQNRMADYILCLENMQLICPEWGGKPVFWGESEGGMLAASLAEKAPQTAAVLLLATGGGMKPQQEVKLALAHYLESQGAIEDEINEYMDFLDQQMTMMIADPTSDQQFLGNTYKWWASFLSMDKVISSLKSASFPICFIHGVKDDKIPVLSADLAYEDLVGLSDRAYIRFYDYGHNLDTAEVQEVAFGWLISTLFGQVPPYEISIAKADEEPVSLENIHSAMSDYVFNRGKDSDNGESGGGKGSVYAELNASKDSDGNGRISADAGYKYHSDSGWDFNVGTGASASTDNSGNTRGEVHGKMGVSKDF